METAALASSADPHIGLLSGTAVGLCGWWEMLRGEWAGWLPGLSAQETVENMQAGIIKM